MSPVRWGGGYGTGPNYYDHSLIKLPYESSYDTRHDLFKVVVGMILLLYPGPNSRNIKFKT